MPDLLDGEPLAGVGILTTLKTLGDSHAFTDVLSGLPEEVPVFGGSSDSYINKSSYVNDEYTCVFDGKSYTNQGILVILCILAKDDDTLVEAVTLAERGLRLK